ncbi:hypothetical protein [Alteribacillus sp. HJP-4]|uniref:hypothetical protein n=1 Tax=Alteribacillus sp. HJP-4 TaxID=2775394 RepID=UPI0035CCE4F0
MEKDYKKNRQAHESAEYDDFANVEAKRDYVFPETLPEGPYGSPINKKPGKTSPWRKGQRSYSAFNYENKSLHEDIPRKYPVAHPVHDNEDK